MISTTEIINWNTTNPFRSAMADKEFVNLPFKTLTGLNDER